MLSQETIVFLNYLGLRKKANECLFEWNHEPFGTAIKQSATHTKHSCCGLTADISKVIQSIVRGKWWKAVWVTFQKCLGTDDSVSACVCLYRLCIYFLKKISSSLVEWSWPHFIDTLKATRIQLPICCWKHAILLLNRIQYQLVDGRFSSNSTSKSRTGIEGYSKNNEVRPFGFIGQYRNSRLSTNWIKLTNRNSFSWLNDHRTGSKIRSSVEVITFDP